MHQETEQEGRGRLEDPSGHGEEPAAMPIPPRAKQRERQRTLGDCDHPVTGAMQHRERDDPGRAEHQNCSGAKRMHDRCEACRRDWMERAQQSKLYDTRSDLRRTHQCCGGDRRGRGRTCGHQQSRQMRRHRTLNKPCHSEKESEDRHRRGPRFGRR
jgi:hypothetical protein